MWGRPECRLAPEVVHPEADVIEKQVHAWAAGLGLLSERMRRGRAPMLAARALPDGDRDVVELAALWVTWFFLVEDWVDRGGTVAATSRVAVRIRAAVGRRPIRPTNRRLELAFDALWRRTSELPMSRQWFDRFGRHLSAYGLALVWERRLAASGRVVSWEEHLRSRPVAHSLFLWDLVEAATGQEVDEGLRLWRWLRRASVEVVAWRNDVASVERESVSGDGDNAVVVIQRLRGCPRDEARIVVERLIAQRVGDLARYEAALVAAGAGQEATARVWARQLVAGHGWWLSDSGRYPSFSPIH